MTNPTFTWSIQEGTTGGNITSGGLYTAPSSGGIFHVQAASSTDPNNFGLATVTVDPIAVIPNPASVAMGSSLTFSADQAVNWAVQEAGGGSITASGLYSAPQTEGTFHIVATSQANASVQITVPVTVKAAAALTWTGDRVYAFGSRVRTSWAPGAQGWMAIRGSTG